MMKSYFYSFVRNNKIKVALLLLSLSIYYALINLSITLDKSIPDIAAVPLKSIGVQTIVQKTGKIPEKMVGLIFPHSNAPINEDERAALTGLPFVEGHDSGLYFWAFDKKSFKAVLGVDHDSHIVGDILKNNMLQGSFDISGTGVLVTDDFAKKNSLSPGAKVDILGNDYIVSGILKPNISGNIIPADIYMNIVKAATSARKSAEMQKLYALGEDRISNVVLLRTNPAWTGDKEKAIKVINKDLLVFSERTFTREIQEQLRLISASGRIMFLVLGTALLIAFCLLIMFNLKTREKEIAVLRMLGWRISDLKMQFIGETLVLLAISLIAGNLLALAGLGFLRTRTISMELPWDISAKPHFLPQENSIERIITAQIPIHIDWLSLVLLSAVFLGIFLAINYGLFYRLRNIKPQEIQGR
jgi:ABC-type antimicrobial peptide transport system permease subunit